MSELNKIPFRLVIISNRTDTHDTGLIEKGIIVKISKRKIEPIAKAKGRFCVYREPVSVISLNLIFNIMIQKRNITVIAPQ